MNVLTLALQAFRADDDGEERTATGSETDIDIGRYKTAESGANSHENLTKSCFVQTQRVAFKHASGVKAET